MRLVMTPDRMVIAEAMRTFTYLNLYGYLTDAVIVNRVFPDEVGAVLRRVARAPAGDSSRACATASPPCRCCARRTSREEVVGAAMLDELGDALFARAPTPAAVLHDTVTQELVLGTDGASSGSTCRSRARATSR